MTMSLVSPTPTVASSPLEIYEPREIETSVSRAIFLGGLHQRLRNPGIIKVNNAAKVSLLGVFCITLFMWVFYRCRRFSPKEASSRRLAHASSDEESESSGFHALEMLAEVCSSLSSSPPLSAEPLERSATLDISAEATFTARNSGPSRDGGLAPEKEELHILTRDSVKRPASTPENFEFAKRPRVSSPGPGPLTRGDGGGDDEEDDEEDQDVSDSVDALFSVTNLSNVPRFPSSAEQHLEMWEFPESYIMANGYMSAACAAAIYTLRSLVLPELTLSQVNFVMERARSLPLYMHPIPLNSRRKRRPYVIAGRIGQVLMCVDTLFRVTEMFPTATNYLTWWNSLMSKLNLRFDYVVFRSRNSTVDYIEECRNALLMYTQRQRPDPELLHRLLSEYRRQHRIRGRRRRQQSAALGD